jgi:hypothetical protein
MTMNRSIISLCAMLCASVVSATFPAQADAASAPYPHMAPLAQYMMSDRQSEIDFARTAAPKAISGHATVVVLDAHGYVTAAKGTNGFTCIVERSWTKAFDDDNFWNPRVKTPICYNPPASRTVLPYTYFETKMALAGATEAAIRTSLTAAIADKQLSVPENGSMAYMMSKDQYIDDHVKAWYSHIMIYTPRPLGTNSGESWGADRVGSPVVYDSNHLIWPQPWALFFVPVWRWSDGTSDPM